MQPTKAHIEAGPFKFDFEGDSDVVTQKIEMVTPLIERWLEKYAGVATQTPIPPPTADKQVPKHEARQPDIAPSGDGAPSSLDPSLEKLFKKGKIVSLHTRPDAPKAFLLILYGYKVLMNQEVVGSAQLAKSFIDTGVTGYTRLSRVAEPLESGGLINISGQRKGTRYVLTNAGFSEAEKILQDIKGK